MAAWSARVGRSHVARVSRGTDLKGCVDGRVQGVVNRVLKYECAGVKVGVLASKALWMGVRIADMNDTNSKERANEHCCWYAAWCEYNVYKGENQGP